MAFETYRDDFETGVLDTHRWTKRQIDDRQISFPVDATTGARSVKVTVRDGDGGVNCARPCQRAEIRTHGALRPEHADAFWQGFSFRTSGDIAPSGSLRTVIGQWKAPGDESPFLAQRFDNGVFHITVQDGPNRRTVASAEGDPDRLDRFQDLVGELQAAAPGSAETVRALADLRATRRLHGAVAPTAARFGLLERASAILDETEDQDEGALFDEFCFIHDLDCYAARPAIAVARHGRRMLPDPKAAWVRMAYRIKAGRRDNDPRHAPRREGEVDVYANGELIAEVRGDLGYQVASKPNDPTIYFKFGVYRDLTTGVLNLDFDDFRQGATAADVM